MEDNTIKQLKDHIKKQDKDMLAMKKIISTLSMQVKKLQAGYQRNAGEIRTVKGNIQTIQRKG